MKKIIDGLVYDHYKAKHIALNKLSEDSNPSSFRYWSESLYMTKKGNFFVYGEGGALTSYSQSCGDKSSCGSEDITALSQEEAIKWCEDNADDQTEILKILKKRVVKLEEA